MNERIKSEMETFEELYPAKEVADNPFIAIEAVGYLRCLTKQFPSEADQFQRRMDLLILTATLKMVIND